MRWFGAEAELTLAQFTEVGSQIRKGAIVPSEPRGDGQFRGNELTRITLDQAVLKRIEPLPETRVRQLRGTLRRLCFVENVIYAGPSVLVATHVDFSHNTFENLRGDAGAVAGRSTVFVGNFAPNDFRLLNFAWANQKAANLGINIVDAS